MFLLFTMLITLVSSNAAQSQEARPSLLEPGSMAPVMTLKDMNGTALDLGDFIGQVTTVISFWSIYCDRCVDEMLSLQKLENKYRGQGLAIIAVNEDIQVPVDRIQRFLDRLEKFRGEISYPLIYDEKSKLFNSFGASTLPILVLIDKAGRIVGYYHGFDSSNENELLSLIEDLVAMESEDLPVREKSTERIELISVLGEASLCGFFDRDGWRKSFTGNESIDQEIELTRELAQRHVRRAAVTKALEMIGIELNENEPVQDCITGTGIYLDRDPYHTGDSVSNLLGFIKYEELFETVLEQDLLIDNTWYASRTLRVSLDNFKAELETLDYLFEPVDITFTYVNMSLLDRKQFLNSLLNQSRFIGMYVEEKDTPLGKGQSFYVYTSSQNFADEILGMDFKGLRVFVEEVTPTSLELEVWK